jgi:CheY-like chemotaxis protein
MPRQSEEDGRATDRVDDGKEPHIDQQEGVEDVGHARLPVDADPVPCDIGRAVTSPQRPTGSRVGNLPLESYSAAMIGERSLSGRRVVIVEDEVLAREHASVLVEELGFPVSGFATADAAIAFLEEHAAEVLVLFTDVILPGDLDGAGLAHRSRRNWPWIKVIVSSGRIEPGPGDLPEGVEFIAKPWLPLDVIRAITRPADERFGAGEGARPD